MTLPRNNALHLQTDERFKRTFLFLAITQALHSLEEYAFELWEYLNPARFLSGLVSEDLPFGFAVINSAIVALIFWSYATLLRHSIPTVSKIAWFWAILETLNGAGHLWFGFSTGGYFPGLYTAPFLLIFAGILLRRLTAVHTAT